MFGLIPLDLTPRMALLFTEVGLTAKLSGDPPLDPARRMYLTSGDIDEILVAVPPRGRTGMALRRRAKEAREIWIARKKRRENRRPT